jgi:glycogen debranching enzyme
MRFSPFDCANAVAFGIRHGGPVRRESQQSALMSIRRIGRSYCADRGLAERREWLVTNGRGGYAMGTVAGTLTRAYHGLLIAALDPPVARRLLVASAQTTLEYDGRVYALATNDWGSGLRDPEGWRFIDGFAVVDGVPTWTYAVGDALVELSIAMAYGRDETVLVLRSVRARSPVEVRMRLLVADRDHHGGALPDPDFFTTTVAGDRATVALPACRRLLHVWAPGGTLSAARVRWSDFELQRERERGLPDRADYLHALEVAVTLPPQGRAGVAIGLAAPERIPPATLDATLERNRRLSAGAKTPLLAELAHAADAFIVDAGEGGASRPTVIAGYPWFADWGRDTMIALPGLALATGRLDVATATLRAYAPFIDRGMLPNRFPDDGAPPEYNTVDAALWFIETVRATAAEPGVDPAFARELFPALAAIVDGYTKGTRYGIGVDPDDGLVRAGVPGVQLTWMDAKVGDWVVTPRIGKPVEINALWFCALKTVASFAEHCDVDSTPYEQAAAHVAESFERYWNAERDCCFDVLDGPNGADPALRPNQLIAVALAPELLGPARSRAVVDACARELLTPVGLRTLSPYDPGYVGRYGGDQRARDAAYHQGTVWPWLLGTFVRAHLNVYDDPVAARGYLTGLIDGLEGYAVGTLGEIFEGDAPHAPCGAIAQAWSVGELISALRLVDA